jgi:hypothetical protein
MHSFAVLARRPPQSENGYSAIVVRRVRDVEVADLSFFGKSGINMKVHT